MKLLNKIRQYFCKHKEQQWKLAEIAARLNMYHVFCKNCNKQIEIEDVRR